MPKFKKFCPNVFLAECETPHAKGDVIEITSQRGNTHEYLIHNLVAQKPGVWFYSITRQDGHNHQAYIKGRAERRARWAESASRKSDEAYNRSRKDSGFLSLGEPIKVGHHSEKRHRAAIEAANNNMRKSVEASNMAAAHIEKAEYWERRANEINLSMPESLEYYEAKVERLAAEHLALKTGAKPREHSYSLTYAAKHLKDAKRDLETAKVLWGD